MIQMPLPSGVFSSSIDSSEETGPKTLEIDIICHRISVVKMTGQMSSSTDEYRGPLTTDVKLGRRYGVGLRKRRMVTDDA